MAIGFQSDEIRRVLNIGEPAPLRAPQAEQGGKTRRR
jgi:hypothetical protein